MDSCDSRSRVFLTMDKVLYQNGLFVQMIVISVIAISF